VTKATAMAFLVVPGIIPCISRTTLLVVRSVSWFGKTVDN